MNIEAILLSEISQTQMAHTVWSHLHETPGKFMKQNVHWRFPGTGSGNGELLLNDHWGLFFLEAGNENILEIMLIVDNIVNVVIATDLCT